MLTYFLFLFFLPWKVKNATLKVAQKWSNFYPWASQTEEFMFQNVAYRPTVYKTGDGVQYAEKLRRNDKKHDSR